MSPKDVPEAPVVSDEAVEKVAEAIWRAEPGDAGALNRARARSVWENQSLELRAKWRHLARAAIAAAQPHMVPDGARHYLETHGQNCRAAMLIAQEHAEVSLPDIDDKSYWEHEIHALDAALRKEPL